MALQHKEEISRILGNVGRSNDIAAISSAVSTTHQTSYNPTGRNVTNTQRLASVTCSNDARGYHSNVTIGPFT